VSRGFHSPEDDNYASTNETRDISLESEKMLEIAAYMGALTALRMAVEAKLQDYPPPAEGDRRWAIFHTFEAMKEGEEVRLPGYTETLLMTYHLPVEQDDESVATQVTRIITNEHVTTFKDETRLSEDMTFTEDGGALYMVDAGTVNGQYREATDALLLPPNTVTTLFLVGSKGLEFVPTLSCVTPQLLVPHPHAQKLNTGICPFGDNTYLGDRQYALHVAERIVAGVLDIEPTFPEI
jgi:hypothetical protein